MGSYRARLVLYSFYPSLIGVTFFIPPDLTLIYT